MIFISLLLVLSQPGAFDRKPERGWECYKEMVLDCYIQDEVCSRDCKEEFDYCIKEALYECHGGKG